MKNFEHGGNVYESGKISDWLDMSANINPFGMSEHVKNTILNNIDGLIHYPDPSMQELKSAISKRYEVDEKNLIALNGAAEFFYLFFNAIRPEKILIAVPSFSEYERAAIASKSEAKYFFTHAQDNFEINFDLLINFIREENIDCAVLANPNNPTGNFLNAENISELLNVVKYLLIDESFIDFVDGHSIKKLFCERLIIVQSLTKIFSIPGLRLGFAIADENLIERLELCKDVWNVNYLAQKVGSVALSDDDYIIKTQNWIADEKIFICERFKQINHVKIFNPTVNFILMKFETKQLAIKVLNNLRDKKILLRHCENFRGLDGRYIRMAIKFRKENERTIELIEGVLNDDKNNFDSTR